MATTYQTPGVYIEEVDRGTKPIEGVGTAVAAFVGFTRRAKQPGKAVQITSWNQFILEFTEEDEEGNRESPFVEGAYLPHAVYGYFLNGGGRCYVISVAALGATDDPARALPARAVIPTANDPKTPSLSVTARRPGLEGNEITVKIEHDAPTSSPDDEDEGSSGSDDTFRLIVNPGQPDEQTIPGLTMTTSSPTVAEQVQEKSKLIELTMEATSGKRVERLPAEGTYKLAGGKATELAVAARDFEGDGPKREGIKGLEALDDVTMICVPDLMSAYLEGYIDLEGIIDVQGKVLTHCKNMKYRFAILDAPPEEDGTFMNPQDMKPQDIADWRMDQAKYDSKYGAVYYPWIKVANPFGSNGTNMLVPPSGHIAGIYARSDNQRGVHKAPANEVVLGANGLGINVTKGEQDSLNPKGVNCIRAFSGRGIRVWGARTLSTTDASWRYINVRRLFNFVEASIEAGTQWVVFEPNDQDLWARVRRDVSAFLRTVWRSGALFGATPEEAFYVKCDEELNPPEERDLGRLIIEVGLAPVKPAEFVIFRISQWAGPNAETG